MTRRGKAEWFTPTALADFRLPGLPWSGSGIRMLARKAGWQRPAWKNERWRPHKGRGGGVEYHISLLSPADVAAIPHGDGQRSPIDGWWQHQSEVKRASALQRVRMFDAVERLIEGGAVRTIAVDVVARQNGFAFSTVYRWLKIARAVPRSELVMALTPRHYGRRPAKMKRAVWAAFLADYLRPQKPTFADCYRRLELMAVERGWQTPSLQQVRAKLRTIPAAIIASARSGEAA